ncbi:hypothetical protein RJ40_01690 [Methanofollis aquaemaris]|uniref:Uncharacterized protein n=1 Tax=Methanofollis aquaemaris TaxID=126734 RepID=A0A8A3S3I8_9EURY|nr:hypothetical protein [Methanofollis aquaemaris]QSZ66301.1 hypothetical protein RJ40_01690 [Methanofollis aquaemaris]
MNNSFDSTYIIRKERFDEFLADIEGLALTAYTVPAFTALELYLLIDMNRDIAVRVVWKPETTVKEIKGLDAKWFLEEY